MKPASYTPAYGLLEAGPQPFATTHAATGPFTGPGNCNPSIKERRLKSITVYTLPVCRQCNMTKNWLTKKGVPFDVVDATADEQTADAIRAIAAADGIDGKPTMPYVQYSTGDPETDFHWFGFIPAFLEKYATTISAAA